jgi:hypothetical protein
MIKYFLIGATRQELLDLAHERGVSPDCFRLIRHPEDLYCYRDGELVIGQTGKLVEFFKYVEIARKQNIKVPNARSY